MQARFQGGIFLGKRVDSNEAVVSTVDGAVVKCRDFREVTNENAFCPELLKKVFGTPYQPTSGGAVRNQARIIPVF